MTWQCPRCLVEFREEPAQDRPHRVAKCEIPGCNVRYKDVVRRPGNVAMYLLDETEP